LLSPGSPLQKRANEDRWTSELPITKTDSEQNYGKPMPKVTPEPKPAAGLGVCGAPAAGRGASMVSRVSAPLTKVIAVSREGSAPLVLETRMVSPTLTSAIAILGKRSSMS
jgi:hypothetical protein